MTAITERVAAGAAFLDEHDPGWWKAGVERAIDLDELDLGDPDHCILGQRCPLDVLASFIGSDDEDELSHGSWRSYQAYAVALSGMHYGQMYSWAEDLGFNGLVEEYYELTGEWKHVITGRRAAVTA